MSSVINAGIRETRFRSDLHCLRYMLVIGLACLSLWLDAQVPVNDESPFYERRMYAWYTIEHMRNHVVLVRLRTDYNNISQLEDMLKDTTLNVRERKSVEAALMQKQYNVSYVNNTLIRGFNTDFQFVREVYFFYDTSSTAIRNGDFAGHVYDRNLLPVDFTPAEDPYIPFYVIMSAMVENTHGIAVHDHHFNLIPRPFPGFVSMRFEEPSFMVRAFQILYRGRYFPVAKLNRRLFRFLAIQQRNMPQTSKTPGNHSTP